MNHPRLMPVENNTSRRAGEALGIPHGALLALGLLVLSSAVSVVYFPAAGGPFIFDDSATIVDNPSIRQLWPLWGSGENGGPLNPPGTTPVYGRPLVNVTLAVNYFFGQLDPFGYRVVHIVVHLLSAVLLWAIVAETLRLEYFRGRFESAAGSLAFAVALIWALHPVDTESVVYVTQRTELLMGLFYLAALYASLRYWAATRRAMRATLLMLATLACLAGMLCKEMMASAPVMVLLYERTFLAGSFRRAVARSWPLYVGLALTWLPVLALNFHGARTPGAGFGRGVEAHVWWMTQIKALCLYLKLAVWPWPLVIHYEIPYLTTFAEAWPWLLAAGLLAIGTCVLVWRRSAVGFVAVWFVAVLSPTLVIPLVGETAAERRMYLPLAAIVPLIVVGGYVALQHCWRLVARRAGLDSISKGPVVVFSVAVTALAIGFGCLSSRRLEAYQDELTLWQDAVLHQPHDPLVQYNLGTLYAESGQLTEAIRHFQQAVRHDPRSYRARFNLARALEGTGRTEEAIEQYRLTLTIRSDDSAAHYNLARLLEDAGRATLAIDHYRQAITARPDFSAAHTNLGILLLDSGHTRLAIEHLEAALRHQADLVNTMNLMQVYARANRLDDAIAMAEQALTLARSGGDAAMVDQLEAVLAYLRTQRSAP